MDFLSTEHKIGLLLYYLYWICSIEFDRIHNSGSRSETKRICAGYRVSPEADYQASDEWLNQEPA